MTAARQQRKPARRRTVLLAACGLVLAVGGRPPGVAGAATTERVVIGHHTGLAIGGFDPVAYFVDGRPLEGRPEIELRFAGAVWRFRNVGNRDAFVRDPQTYLPRYGGYDPTAIARGASAAGHPDFWLVRDRRLYLFRGARERDAFARDAESIVDMADRNWPVVLKTLTP